MSYNQMRLLAVHAHPDDESSKGAATFAHYQEKNAQIMVVSCTGGERGDILNEKLQKTPNVLRDLAGHRRQEMWDAANFLQIQHRWLGYYDSGFSHDNEINLAADCFANISVDIAKIPLVKIIRQFKPHVLVSYDENGGYPHPDHIMSNRISVAAFKAAADPNFAPHLGQPWQVTKFYYERIFNLEKFETLHNAFLEAKLSSPLTEMLGYWKTRTIPESVKKVTTKIDCGKFFVKRDSALKFHQSQLSEKNFFFAIPPQMQSEVWPWEEYVLVESKVATTFPETDLFAGIV